MPTFIVEGRHKDGKVQKYRVEGDSSMDAAAKVAARGITAGTVIEEATPIEPSPAPIQGPHITAQDVHQIIASLASSPAARRNIEQLLTPPRSIWTMDIGVFGAIGLVVLVIFLVGLGSTLITLWKDDHRLKNNPALLEKFEKSHSR